MNNVQNKNKQQKSKKSKVQAPRTRKSGNGGRDFGQQLASVVKKGYGATLASFPTTRAFGKVYLDPFSCESARIPDFPVMASTLVRLEHEVVVTSCVEGYGWALFQPLAMISNVQDCAWVTTAGEGIPPPQFKYEGTRVTSQRAASPYNNGTFSTEGKAVRLVAWGMSVQNISATYNRGGKAYMGQATPRYRNSFIDTDDSNLRKYPGYKTASVGNDRAVFYHRMITERSDLRYNTYKDDEWVYADDGSRSDENEPYMGVYLRTGATAAAEQFVVRFVGHFEVIGQTVNTPGLGVTKSDTKGLERLVSAGLNSRNQSPTSTDHISALPPARQESVVSEVLKGANNLLSPAPKLTGMILDSLMN